MSVKMIDELSRLNSSRRISEFDSEVIYIYLVMSHLRELIMLQRRVGMERMSAELRLSTCVAEHEPIACQQVKTKLLQKTEEDLDTSLHKIMRKYDKLTPDLPRGDLEKMFREVADRIVMRQWLEMMKATGRGDKVKASKEMFVIEPVYLLIAMIDIEKLTNMLQGTSKEFTRTLAAVSTTSNVGRLLLRLRTKQALIKMIAAEVKEYKSSAELILKDRKFVNNLLKSASLTALARVDIFEDRFLSKIARHQKGGGITRVLPWIIYLLGVVVFFLPLTVLAMILDLLFTKEKQITRSSVILLRRFTRALGTDDKLDHVFSFVLHRYLGYSDGIPVVPALLMNNPRKVMQPWEKDHQRYVAE